MNLNETIRKYIPFFGTARLAPVRPDSPSDISKTSPVNRTERTSSKGPLKHPEINLLNEAQKANLLERAKLARLEFKEAKGNQAQRYKIIQEYFTPRPNDESTDYLKHPIIQQFVEDSRLGDYYKTRALISKLRPNFILGVFQVKYVPGLEEESLELMTFKEHKIDEKILEQYPSNAIAVEDAKLTPGFAHEKFVALFEEFWPIKDSKHKKDPSSKAYYIVDTFIERFKRITIPLIKTFAPEAFGDLTKEGIDEYLKKAIALWLSGHEHFHATGFFPWVYRPTVGEDFDKTKSLGSKIKARSILAAAFEEARVDLNVLVTINYELGKHLFGKDVPWIKNFILCDRNLRYIAQEDPSKNFDSIVNLVLRNFLLKNPSGYPAIHINNNQLQLSTPAIINQSLERLLQEMNDLEEEITNAYPKFSNEEAFIEHAVNKIEEFMRTWGRSEEFNRNKKKDQEAIKKYQTTRSKLKPEIKKAHDLKNIDLEKTLRAKLKTAEQEYIEYFFPLSSFDDKLRETYNKLPQKEVPKSDTKVNPIVKTIPREIPLEETLHANLSPEYITPTLVDDIEDIRNEIEPIAKKHKKDINNLTRENADKFYIEHLRTCLESLTI